MYVCISVYTCICVYKCIYMYVCISVQISFCNLNNYRKVELAIYRIAGVFFQGVHISRIEPEKLFHEFYFYE